MEQSKINGGGQWDRAEKKNTKEVLFLKTKKPRSLLAADPDMVLKKINKKR